MLKLIDDLKNCEQVVLEPCNLGVPGGRYIEVFRVDNSGGKAKRDKRDKEVDRNFTRSLKEDEVEEDVAESGRLFARNLPYTCTEEELRELFSKHGQKRTVGMF